MPFPARDANFRWAFLWFKKRVLFVSSTVAVLYERLSVQTSRFEANSWMFIQTSQKHKRLLFGACAVSTGQTDFEDFCEEVGGVRLKPDTILSKSPAPLA